MIDNLSLALSHGLMLLVAWRLIFRPDLDDDDAVSEPQNTGFFGHSTVNRAEETDHHA
jgi:hypothetical protein